MANGQSVALFEMNGSRVLVDRLGDGFQVLFFSEIDALVAHLEGGESKLLVLDMSAGADATLSLCRPVFEHEDLDVPVVVYAARDDLSLKLESFEMGCDDFLYPSIPDAELSARLMKSIFNKIANDQLKSRIKQANEMAFTAMSNTSDLGYNIQFLLDSYHCDNIDQLGQLFFRVVKNYDIKCSLQLRSEFAVKNMEENGLAKDLESTLLSQLKEAGRFYDFGHRTVINYNQVSILIKNMPIHDPVRYGMIKDNIFALVQGLDARIKALDTMDKVALEKELLEKVTLRVQDIMRNVDESYQKVMRDIAVVVDDMADSLSQTIPALGLSEAQEALIETTVETGILATQRVFNQGLRVDESFMSFMSVMSGVLGMSEQGVDALKLQRLLSQMDGGSGH